MPEISRFFGMVVQMYYADHEPPHFHVRYAEHRALISIETLSVLRGGLPPRALGLVTEWAAAPRRIDGELAISEGRGRAKAGRASGVVIC